MVPDVTATLRRAAELSGSGKHREAVRLLSDLVSEHPGNAAVLCQLAGEQLHVGAPTQALALARRAMIVLPGHYSPHLLAALAHTDLGEHDDAVAAARTAVAEAPRVWQCHSGLAEALTAQGGEGALRDAEDSAARAVELAPEEGRPYEVLGDAALLRHDWGRAEWAYRTALRLRPKSAVAERGLRVVRKERDARARAEPRSARGGGPVARRWRRNGGSGEPEVGGTGTPDEGRDEERIERDTRRQELGRGVEAVLWPLFRKMWLVQAGGALLLLLTSMPDSTRIHGLAGLLVAIAVVLLPAHGLRRVPPARRGEVIGALRGRALLLVCGAVLGAGTVLLAGWSLLVLVSPGTVQPLSIVVLVSAAAGLLGLARNAARR
ncbi:hypothetical protein G443_004110 [Actinoalloteichus cyanogriseus DSM 43889]|uniref:Tetratricopeptide repeat protein n=1 Tax=Actinoalloteichus caeruleus DSM 43889 TaxID=1120930 RepID=A0ABT1JMT1_ACTCY|nr:hypothetical protein [Actinoalloteichus caeruleus DSM 43889]